MRHIMALVLVLLSLTMAPAYTVAQEATPAAGEVASTAGIDLPALAMTGTALAAAGYPAVTSTGQQLLVSPADYAATYTYAPIAKAVYANALKQAGFQGAHVAYWQIVDPASDATQRELTTYVESYADAAGAMAGITAVEALYLTASSHREVVNEPPTIGDQSMIFRDTDIARSATPTAEEAEAPHSITLVFRLGSVVAGVDITDYTGQLPPLADLEPLAEAMSDQLEMVLAQDAPGLAFQALRVSPATTAFDGYENRDGVLIPRGTESREQRQLREALWGGPHAVYRSAAYVASGGEGYDDDLLVQNILVPFADEDAAQAYLERFPTAVEATSDYADIVLHAMDAGDAGLALTYTVHTADGKVFHVRRAVVRKGTMITDIALRAVDSSPSAAWLDALVSASLACLHTAGWCPEEPVSTDLAPSQLATPTP